MVFFYHLENSINTSSNSGDIIKEKDIKPRQIELSDSHKSELIEEFILMYFMTDGVSRILDFVSQPQDVEGI